MLLKLTNVSIDSKELASLTEKEKQDLIKELQQPETPKLPETWEECAKILKGKKGFFIDDCSVVLDSCFTDIRVDDNDKNIVTTEKQAQSVLAFTQLLTITTVLNERADDEIVFVHWDKYKNRFIWHGVGITTPIPIRKSLYTHFITHYSDLLKQFFMVD